MFHYTSLHFLYTLSIFFVFAYLNSIMHIWVYDPLWLLKNKQTNTQCLHQSLDMHFIKYLFVPYYRTVKLFQTNKAFGSEQCVAQFLCSHTSFSFCTAFDMNKFYTLITNLFTWFTLTVSFLDISLQISQTLPSIKIVLMA